jgi:transcription elongation factor GreA
MTREGYDALISELETLKRVERPKIIRAIEEARSHGDLSENAEYEAAKDKQGFIEGRISELEYKLNQADIIDPTKMPKDRAVFGSRVVLENTDTGETVQYQLVGPEESNIDEGRISITSPLGKALVLSAPGGKRCYELIEIL